MTKSNAINDGVIKELLATVKSLQADMVELKSGANGGSNLLIDQCGHATLPSNGSEVSGNPCKRCLSGEAMDSSEGRWMVTKAMMPSDYPKKTMPSSRQHSSPDLTTLPGARKMGFPRASG